jgi:hypothetical protein
MTYSGTITYWYSDPKDPSKSHGHAQVEGFGTVVSLSSTAALKNTGRRGVCDKSDVTTLVPCTGEKISIPIVARYVWRRGGPGKKRGFGYYAPCWIRSISK